MSGTDKLLATLIVCGALLLIFIVGASSYNSYRETKYKSEQYLECIKNNDAAICNGSIQTVRCLDYKKQ